LFDAGKCSQHAVIGGYGMLPRELKYTKEHEWIKVEGDRVTVGITDFAQSELGDVVFIDLPAIGQKVESGATLATVESVKAVSDIYAPVSGEVVAVNEDLEHSPEFVNQDSYGKGWIAILELTGDKKVMGLLTADEYQALIEK
jgi:glycine cleavage system H protein